MTIKSSNCLSISYINKLILFPSCNCSTAEIYINKLLLVIGLNLGTGISTLAELSVDQFRYSEIDGEAILVYNEIIACNFDAAKTRRDGLRGIKAKPV